MRSGPVPLRLAPPQLAPCATTAQPRRLRCTNPVSSGVSDATFKLINTFYVPYADGIDVVTPVVIRAMATIDELRRTGDLITAVTTRTNTVEIPPDTRADELDAEAAYYRRRAIQEQQAPGPGYYVDLLRTMATDRAAMAQRVRTGKDATPSAPRQSG